MVKCGAVVLLLGLAAASAFPSDSIISKLGHALRYQYVEGPDSRPRLADLWLKTSDLPEVGRFNPDSQNVYHLFTRQNPTVSQPLLIGSEGLLAITNFEAWRRTVVILHGWGGSATDTVSGVLVPAFLSAEDVNVVVVDWSVGAGTSNYLAAVSNTVTSGQSVARFVSWLSAVTGNSGARYHIIGNGMGAHQAGIVGRNVGGDIAYITGLDPDGPGWVFNSNRFHQNDGVYTEVIHTNAGLQGYLATLADVDFYPNGGLSQPGCGNSQSCDHDRSIHFMAESLRTGGFLGRRCATYIGATTGFCILWGNLNMGGIAPKTGSSGIFWMQTNAGPPFSRG